MEKVGFLFGFVFILILWEFFYRDHAQTFNSPAF